MTIVRTRFRVRLPYRPGFAEVTEEVWADSFDNAAERAGIRAPPRPDRGGGVLVDDFVGTRAEREWLPTLRGIREALEASSEVLARHNDRAEETDGRHDDR